MKISKVLEAAVEHYIPLSENGVFPGGHNGPYFDPETPVRNTAHFLFLLSEQYKRSGDPAAKAAAEGAIRYLKGPMARPHGKTYNCRNKAGKDRCNGLIGQAWVIEAMIAADEAFGRPDCYQLADELFLLHPFDENVGLWHRVDVDGATLSFDGTFNHQLWFAAAAALLRRTPAAQERAKIFLERVASQVDMYRNGVVFHDSKMGSVFGYSRNGIRAFLSQVRLRTKARQRRRELYSKSVGYHGFNLTGYAMLKSAFPNARLWSTPVVEKLLEVCEDPRFKAELESSEYGFFYNTSGIEIAYALETFGRDVGASGQWVQRQFDLTWSPEDWGLTNGAKDKCTAMARIYLAGRLREDYDVAMLSE